MNQKQIEVVNHLARKAHSALRCIRTTDWGKVKARRAALEELELSLIATGGYLALLKGERKTFNNR